MTREAFRLNVKRVNRDYQRMIDEIKKDWFAEIKLLKDELVKDNPNIEINEIMELMGNE